MSTALIKLAEKCGMWSGSATKPRTGEKVYFATAAGLEAFASALSEQEGKPSRTLAYYAGCLRRIAAEVIAENHLGWGNELNDLADRVDIAATPSPTQARASAPETPTMGDGWCVTVERWGDKVLSISDQHYSGRELDEADEALIIGAAQHLLSFVGYGLPPSRFDPDEARASDAEDAARYRLLRRGQQWSVINGIGDALRAEILDASIDAALQGATPASKEAK